MVSPTILVVVLISLMNSPSYRERELAYHTLGRLQQFAIPYLIQSQESQYPEVTCRAASLITSYHQRHAAELATNLLPDNYPCLPWIDELPDDYPDRCELITQFLSRSRKELGTFGSPDWTDYRHATRLFLEHEFANGCSIEAARRLLNQMVVNEREWIRDHGKGYNPPVTLPTR